MLIYLMVPLNLKSKIFEFKDIAWRVMGASG